MIQYLSESSFPLPIILSSVTWLCAAAITATQLREFCLPLPIWFLASTLLITFKELLEQSHNDSYVLVAQSPVVQVPGIINFCNFLALSDSLTKTALIFQWHFVSDKTILSIIRRMHNC